MKTKQKNILIVALLAVVFIMAVGYAAFAQQLTITGTSTITSKWDVHMESGTTTNSSTMGTTSTGTVTVDDGGLTATISAELISPGDKLTFTIPIVNGGTIDAKLSKIALEGTNMTIDNTALTALSSDGNIKYTVTSPGTATLTANGGKSNIVIVAEFVDKTEGNTNAYNSTAPLTVTMNYVQA